MSSQASFDYDPSDDPPLSEPAVQVEVFRYTAASGEYEALPNVQVSEIQDREGLEPTTARFTYICDDRAIASGWPTEFEQIMALAYATGSTGGNRKNKADSGRYVVKPDDRIVVKVTDQHEVTDVVFDGFAQAPQTNIEPRGQSITFVAVSVAIRLFTNPVVTRREAWSALATGFSPSLTKYQRIVHQPARFNADGKPNCTPAALWYDAGGVPTSDEAFPIFYAVGGESQKPVLWTLAGAARYILCQHLGFDNDFCDPPDMSMVDRLLNRRRPKDQKADEPPDPSLFYDPNDSATYAEDPIVLRDFDMSGMRWPEALDRLLTFSGFAAKFVTEGDENGDPWTYIEIYRKDNGGPTDPKSVYLQARRGDVDPSRSNVKSFGVVRDYKNAFNAVAMDSYPALVEVSVVLAMRGPIAEADADHTGDFVLSKITDPGSEKATAYRVWYADELGEGHIKADGTNGDDVFDFKPAFAAFDADEDDPPLRKRRPGRKALVSKDDKGVVRESTLYLSRDYVGSTAKLWDGTGTWQKLPHGWDLLKDRLGVKLTHDDLDKWTIGKEGGDQSKGPILKVITAMAKPTDANKRFFLRLDTVIEADLRAFKDFSSRKASALTWDRYRYLNGKGSFQQAFVHESSPNFEGDKKAGEAAKQDMDVVKDAYSWMAQVQRSGEDPSLSGPITIPWFTTAYRVGDRISGIDGRDLSLQVNQGAGQGEAPAYPFVVGVTFRWGDSEETVLELSDHRAMPDDPHSRRK